MEYNTVRIRLKSNYADYFFQENSKRKPKGAASRNQGSARYAARVIYAALTIDRLGSAQRTLKRLENSGVSETVVSLASIADPEQPVTIENLVAQFAPARKFVCVES